MHTPLFSNSFIKTMDESGFSLFPRHPNAFVIQHYELLYVIEQTADGWTLDHREKGLRQRDLREFKTIGELEAVLLDDIREFKRNRDLLEAQARESV